MTSLFSLRRIRAKVAQRAEVCPSSGDEPCRTVPTAGEKSLEEVNPVEHELDDVICELGRAAERAMADGDPTGARIYTNRMYAAIASRTPEHIARLEREAYDRVTEQVAYFTSDAALALARPA